MLAEAWDSLGRLVAASHKAEDEPRISIYLFMLVMQCSFWLKVVFLYKWLQWVSHEGRIHLIIAISSIHARLLLNFLTFRSRCSVELGLGHHPGVV